MVKYLVKTHCTANTSEPLEIYSDLLNLNHLAKLRDQITNVTTEYYL